MFAGLRKCFVGLFLTITFSVAAVASVDASSSVATTESNKRRYDVMENDIYLLVNHIIRAVVYLCFSGLFAGLTIGIMSMDTLTFDIIATSGPEPDRTYASRVLPLRRQGHQTLCTLILSNILMDVLVVQEIASIMDIVHDLEGRWWIQKAVKGSSELSGFIISTLFIVIFTEIIPMSICKSKYSLQVAAAGYMLVRIAMIVAYPVAMPLGKILDYFVPHGVGQIYDRNELRKLMILHCEAHGDRSGLARSEMLLLIAAMDFHEKKVGEIMVLIETVTKLKADEIITVELIQRLWESGCSRIPVEQSPNSFLGVLLVKDLLTLPLHEKKMHPVTVGEVVRSMSRPLLCVDVNASLPALLRFFQQSKVHMLFVSCGDKDVDEVCNRKVSDCGSGFYSFNSKPKNVVCSNVVGVVTLEDVMEALIQEEIYDEYDEKEFSTRDFSTSKKAVVSVPFSKDILMPLEEPVRMPRVNFFSFFRFQSPSLSLLSSPSPSPSAAAAAAATAAEAVVPATPLTDSQVWAVAYYLTRAVSAFFLWHPGYVKMLLDESGDEQLFPQARGNEINFPLTPHKTNSGDNSKPISLCSGAQGRVNPSSATTPREPTGCLQSVHYTDLISIAAEERFVLYRSGVESKTFTLILGGRVDAAVGPDKFPLTRGPFECFGEDALTLQSYIPDFDAVALFPTRIYRITRECYLRYFHFNDVYNKLCAKHGIDGKERRIFSVCMHPIKSPLTPKRNVSFSYSRKNEKDELLPPVKSDLFYGTFESDKALKKK